MIAGLFPYRTSALLPIVITFLLLLSGCGATAATVTVTTLSVETSSVTQTLTTTQTAVHTETNVQTLTLVQTQTQTLIQTQTLTQTMTLTKLPPSTSPTQSAIPTTGNADWVRQFGPVHSTLQGGVAADGGAVYLIGNVSNALPGQTSSGNNDAYVCKYDAMGNTIWTRQFGTEYWDGVLGVAIDATGVYVAGQTQGAFVGQVNAGHVDAFVRKYSFEGDFIWTKQFGTAGDDTALEVVSDSSGVYVAGTTRGVFPFQVYFGDQDVFLAKFGGDGSLLWARQFGTALADDVGGIVANSSGIYVAGSTMGSFPGFINPGGPNPALIYDAYICKYDANGDASWVKQFGINSSDFVYGAGADNTGVYVAGCTQGALPGQSSAGITDAFLCKYDNQGNPLWTRQFGTRDDDQIRGAVAVTPSGIFVGGRTTGAFPGQSKTGGSDIFVLGYDTSGNMLLQKQFGTSADDNVNALCTGANCIYLSGYTEGTFPEQSKDTGTNAFLARMTV